MASSAISSPAVRHNEGIDLYQARFEVHKEAVKSIHEAGQGLDLFPPQAEPEAKPARLPGLESDSRVHPGHEDTLGALSRHLLDLHSARRRGHEGDLARLPVHEGTKIELAGDPGGHLYQHALHREAVRSALAGHQATAQEAPGLRLHLLDIVHNRDAAGFATSTGLYLCLHHPASPPELRRRPPGQPRRVGNQPLWNRDVVAAKQSFGLKLMQIHRRPPQFLE